MTEKKEIYIDQYRFRLYISREDIEQKVREIARQLQKEYKDANPLFICILDGAFIFASDLVREYGEPCEVHFVKLQSYKGMRSGGEIDVKLPIHFQVKDKDVIIIEDIVDSGNTLTFFMDLVKEEEPRSLKLVTLLSKPEAREYPVIVDYVGFEIPNDFVIGYGLDYDGQGRQLRAIYSLKS